MIFALHQVWNGPKNTFQKGFLKNEILHRFTPSGWGRAAIAEIKRCHIAAHTFRKTKECYENTVMLSVCGIQGMRGLLQLPPINKPATHNER